MLNFDPPHVMISAGAILTRTVLKIRPRARMGYYDYASVESIFTMPPLDEGEKAKRRRVSLVGEAGSKKAGD